ncbi:hypothetical protein ACH5A7_20765 [Streptomyces sp. NPDC018955]|uniref:hypothetical protein n=1 Tax=Streptomyces sp. NPDC018955 TaxID=3365055 RepID=UPI0037A55848
METKLDGIGQGLTELGKDVSDHESRLRALERARWPLPSVAVLTAMGSLGVAVWTAAGR